MRWWKEKNAKMGIRESKTRAAGLKLSGIDVYWSRNVVGAISSA
jgi:hypothetical protein